MIKNDKQLEITRTKKEKFEASLRFAEKQLLKEHKLGFDYLIYEAHIKDLTYTIKQLDDEIVQYLTKILAHDIAAGESS